MRFCRENRLEAMCFKFIVGNLERYYRHDEYINMFNQFLQRRYSNQIFSHLRKSCMLTEDLTYWLISPYWNDVVIGRTYSVSKFVPKLRYFGGAINSISLRNSLTTIEILSAVICCLPNLKVLDLCCTNCSDDLLLLIRKMCPLLNELNISNCKVTDVGMKNLCYYNEEKDGLDSLKVLNIKGTFVKPIGVAYLLKHLNLQVLKHYDLPIVMYNLYQSKVDYFMNDIGTYDLTALDLSPIKLSLSLRNILKVWTTQCPDVENLTILEEIEEEDMNLCLKFQKLKRLKLSGRVYGEHNSLSHFLELRGDNLNELVLHNSFVSVEVIARVCHNLKKLHLIGVMYEDFDESAIQSKIHFLNQVTKLKVKHSYLYADESYKSIYLLLELCKNVEHLSISFVKNFSEKFIDIITSMPQLIKGKFLFTDINETCVKELFTCKNILSLWCDGCPYIRTNENSEILRSIIQVKYGNTLSWQIDYNEQQDD